MCLLWVGRREPCNASQTDATTCRRLASSPRHTARKNTQTDRRWTMSATLVDMGKHDRQADKDADFSAYMSGRQTALYRTAYLLAGDHAGAEDLLQTAFAKLYLSWDRIR